MSWIRNTVNSFKKGMTKIFFPPPLSVVFECGIWFGKKSGSGINIPDTLHWFSEEDGLVHV
jgi:hypothetical protein